jgi:hypothetical protein
MKNQIVKEKVYPAKPWRSGGMALTEALVVLAIFVLVVIVFAAFQTNVFSFNKIIQSNLGTQQDAKKILRPFAEEVRSATISNIGAFPISIAATNTLEFYANIDDDDLIEKIRYFLDEDVFKKGVTKPSGDPYVYDSGDEDIVGVVKNIVNEETSIFEYHDANYYGSATSTPLSYPIDVHQITLVKATLLVDDDPDFPPNEFEISTQAMFRNLKTN